MKRLIRSRNCCATGLSATVVSRLKARRAGEYDAWKRHSPAKQRWVYLRADGIYSGIRAEDERLREFAAEVKFVDRVHAGPRTHTEKSIEQVAA